MWLSCLGWLGTNTETKRSKDQLKRKIQTNKEKQTDRQTDEPTTN